MLNDDGSGIPDEDKGKNRVLLAVRVPPSVAKYVNERAGKTSSKAKAIYGAVTKVVEDALRLHRALYERLGSHKLRVQQFALDERLDWPSQEAETYARLILRGLDAAEAERRRR